jgi:hypothetical protein
LVENSAGARQAIEALDDYVAAVSKVAMADEARAASPMVDGFAKDLQAWVEQAAQALRGTREAEIASLRARTESEISELREEIRQAVRQLVLEGTPLEASRYRMRLVDGEYRWWATCSFGGRLEVTFVIEPHGSTEWHEPRRVSSLVGELAVQVGLKKGWLKKDLAPVLLDLDDLVIGAAVLEPGRAEIHLRKKSDATSGAVVLQLTREGTAVNAEIERPTESGETTMVHAAFEDVGKLEELWNALTDAGESLLVHRVEVDSAALDGADVMGGDGVVGLIDLYVAEFAPIVSEIAQRSPSPRELSLKLEHDDGRREEIYLQKEKLAAHLAAVPADMLQKLTDLEILPSVEFAAG